MIKISNRKVIDCSDWDNLVQKTYGKPYNFQQQEGCQERGIVTISIPEDNTEEESEMNDSIPEVVNGEEMGIKFDVWLARDPEQLLKDYSGTPKLGLELFWDRNFYPNIQTVANDLHKKGLIEAGEYDIKIDW